ncbi:MAG: DNA-3-methyladenine glycosylase 2 family protein [Jatrophihabitantaceae bacterium]
MEREWDGGRPVDVIGTLGVLRRGTGDPAHRVDSPTDEDGGPPTDGGVARGDVARGGGTFWWACATPAGAGTLALSAIGSLVTTRAWGAGASWLLDRAPLLLGEGDDWSELDLSAQPRLADVARRHQGIRLPSTGVVLDSLVPAVLEQRVTGGEAHTAWRGLLRRFGQRAPGPRTDLWVPPGPTELLAVPTWDWHRLGVDARRQRAIRAAATVAARLEQCVSLTPDAALARLQVVPGVGQWTAAETAQRALGHPDAVSVGDYHLADLVVHFFTGRARGTDTEMLDLLAPWAGQRQRIVRLIELSGVRKPKFGPRYAPVDIRRL